MAPLTQLNILVVGHDEDDIWSDVSAVPLDATPEALSSGGGESPAAWSPIQTQQGQPGQPLNQHGVQCNRPHDGLAGGLMGRWKGVEKQSGHSLTALEDLKEKRGESILNIYEKKTVHLIIMLGKL